MIFLVRDYCTNKFIMYLQKLRLGFSRIGIAGTAETILVMEQQAGSKDCKLYVIGKSVEQCKKYLI